MASAWSRDCSVSKEFELKHPQTLAGVLLDPNMTPLPGLGIQLLSGKKIVQELRTNNKGEYDLGQVLPGKYRLRIHYGEGQFCAPEVQCGTKRCILDPKLTINPKNLITVH